jgi:hypothetical protein
MKEVEEGGCHSLFWEGGGQEEGGRLVVGGVLVWVCGVVE